MHLDKQSQFSSLQGGVSAFGGGGGLLEHFKELTVHPKNAEELKGLILQLAIQGKLTAQWRKDNPDVERASVLLEKINAEKAQLIKEKKIKKENPLPELNIDEEPFTLPTNWNWIRLANISSINGGFAFKSSRYVENGVRVIRISDFNERGFKNNKIVRYEYTDDLEDYRLENNNILMAMTGGTVGKTLFVQELEEDMVVNQRVATIKLIPLNSEEYVNCVVQTSLIKDVVEEAKNSTNDNISMTNIKNFFIPIPPLEEQKAIVAIVNQLFQEVEQLEALTKERVQLKADFVTSALQQLTQAEAQDTASQWAFLQEHFGTFFTEKGNVKKLRESILQLAVQGKLTSKWRSTKQLLPRKGEVPQAEGSFRINKPEVPQAEGSFKINNLPHLKTFRKQLRKNLTPAEASLWKMLKGKQLDGKKFRRQHSVGNYILDFFCPEEKLAIELDGQGHFEASQAEYDHERDLFLNHFGIKVLRFENKWVWQNTAGILQAIRDAFGWIEKQPPRPIEEDIHWGDGSENEPPRPADTPPSKGGEWIEHASVLLERIQTEKAQLIADKKIKKEKPLPAIKEEEIPYELPEGWVWCRLGDVIKEKPRNGYSPKGVDFITNTKSLKLGATTKGYFKSNEVKYLNEEIPSDSFLWLKPNDILIQRSNSIDYVGVSAIYDGKENDFVYPDLMMKIQSSNSISTTYLHTVLSCQSTRMYFRDNASGTSGNMPKINQGVVQNTLVPITNHEEQKAIVEKVNALMAWCDHLENEIETRTTTQEDWMKSCLREVFEE